MNVRLHPEAETELDRSIDWRETQTPGSGYALRRAVVHAIAEIVGAPDGWAWWPGLRLNPPVRRYVMARLPYVLPYTIVGDSIVILAVAHAKRRPGYWLARHRSL